MSAITSQHQKPVTPVGVRKRRALYRWSTLNKSRTDLLKRSQEKGFSHVAWVITELVAGSRDLEVQGYKAQPLVQRFRSESFNLGHNGVCYDTKETSKRYITTVKDNQLFQQGQLYRTDGRLHMFIIASDLKLYVRQPCYQPKPHELKYHHSSFVSGRPVASAGEVRTRGSEIQQITDRSGHYKPARQKFIQGLTILQKEYNVDLSTIQIKVHFSKREEGGIKHGGHLYFDDGHQFMITNGNTVPDMISSLQPFKTCSGEKKLTEQGYIEAKRHPHSGRILALHHILPDEEIVSIENTEFGLTPSQKNTIKRKAALNSLKTYQRKGIKLEGMKYTHFWSWGKATYDAAEFLQSEGCCIPLKWEHGSIDREEGATIIHCKKRRRLVNFLESIDPELLTNLEIEVEDQKLLATQFLEEFEIDTSETSSGEDMESAPYNYIL